MNAFTEQLMARQGLKIIETLQLECPIHGTYENNRILREYPDGSSEELPLSGCPECRYDHDRLAIMNRLQADQYAAVYEQAGIPAKFKDCLVRNFSTKDLDAVSSAAKAHARDMAVAFVQDNVRSVVLLGPTDRGKSHLVAAMLKGCIQTGKKALYVVERKIYRDIHESYLGRKDLMTEGQVIDLYSKIDVLAIDEIGRSSWTEHESQILYEIIDKRDCENRKTVMAGNLTPSEFNQKFDDSFKRKLGAAEVVCMWSKWEDIA